MIFKYIDLSMLTMIYEDKPERMKEIILKYAKNISSEIVNLRESHENSELLKRKKSAHNLKSSFRYLGMENEAEIALKIENLEHNDIQNYNKSIDKIDVAWKEAMKEIDIFCAS